jgi:NAD(P)-dependent dehydrogenase (short-subunit alcohol dehydrogenase family)
MDTGGIEQCVAQAAEAAGGTLDGLAYCVGSIVLKPLKSSKDEDFLEAYRLNALGAAAALRAGTKPLTASERPGGGAALLFSTIAVSQGFTNHGVIAAAKGAVEGLTTAIAADWAPKARVNAIAPSLTRTDMAAPMLQNDRMAEAIAGMHPIPRLGEPQDIAGLGAFLLSDRASWITGQIYGVDGGRSRLRPKG